MSSFTATKKNLQLYFASYHKNVFLHEMTYTHEYIELYDELFPVSMKVFNTKTIE